MKCQYIRTTRLALCKENCQVINPINYHRFALTLYVYHQNEKHLTFPNTSKREEWPSRLVWIASYWLLSLISIRKWLVQSKVATIGSFSAFESTIIYLKKHFRLLPFDVLKKVLPWNSMERILIYASNADLTFSIIIFQFSQLIYQTYFVHWFLSNNIMVHYSKP